MTLPVYAHYFTHGACPTEHKTHDGAANCPRRKTSDTQVVEHTWHFERR